ncbi:MAG: 3-dehydroquinate synthase [Pseudomonadota bacterium]
MTYPPQVEHVVKLDLGERSYPIIIGQELLQTEVLRILLANVGSGSQGMLISNDLVFGLFGEQVLDALGQAQVDMFLMRDGEAYKNLESYTQALDALMQQGHNRSTCVYALGGGVVGDLAGFVAATYQRGVNFVQIPTTLLSQVDSSVGGKTAVNHPLGKNMIGAFYQPQSVVIDTHVLNHLPDREYAAGLAEVIKYGVIADQEFFVWLEDNMPALVDKDPKALGYAIKKSVETKAEVVARDEREGGVRAILNFGHTFGHAIENVSGYGEYLHGEAVAIGMIMAGEFSCRLNMFDRKMQERLVRLTDAAGLPIALRKALDVAELVAAIGMDKKVIDGQLRLILARDLGTVEIVAEYPHTQLRDLLSEYAG